MTRLTRLAHFLFRRTRLVIIVAVCGVACAATLGSSVTKRVAPYDAEDRGAESGQAAALFNLVGWTYFHLRAGHRWAPARARRAVLEPVLHGLLAAPLTAATAAWNPAG